MSTGTKVAVGISVTIISTAIIGYIGYRVYRKNKNTDALEEQIDITEQLSAEKTEQTAEKTVVAEPKLPCKPCKCKCCTESISRPTTQPPGCPTTQPPGCPKQSYQKQRQQAGAGVSGSEADATGGAPTPKDEI